VEDHAQVVVSYAELPTQDGKAQGRVLVLFLDCLAGANYRAACTASVTLEAVIFRR
jgi:hypothetical protein